MNTTNNTTILPGRASLSSSPLSTRRRPSFSPSIIIPSPPISGPPSQMALSNRGPTLRDRTTPTRPSLAPVQTSNIIGVGPTPPPLPGQYQSNTTIYNGNPSPTTNFDRGRKRSSTINLVNGPYGMSVINASNPSTPIGNLSSPFSPFNPSYISPISPVSPSITISSSSSPASPLKSTSSDSGRVWSAEDAATVLTELASITSMASKKLGDQGKLSKRITEIKDSYMLHKHTITHCLTQPTFGNMTSPSLNVSNNLNQLYKASRELIDRVLKLRQASFMTLTSKRKRINECYLSLNNACTNLMLNLTISISESNHTNTPSSPIQRTMPKLSFGSTTNSNNSNNNSNNNTNNANNASLSNPLWEPPHLKTPTQVKIVSPPVKETNNLPTPVTPTPSPPAVIVTEEGFLKPVTVISQAEQDLKNGERELMQADKFMLGMGVERNYEFAFNHYSEAAKAGVTDAMNMLGTIYENGLGRAKSTTNALKWYTMAAGKGNAEAQNNLGRIYETGKDVEINYVEAFQWYSKAASAGHVDAITNLGMFLELGLGQPAPDYVGASQHYRNAANMNYERAQNALGSLYYKGRGVPKDYFEAVAWYKKASEKGFPPAQNNLGICYEEGIGVIKDWSIAKELYKKASLNGHAAAANNLGYIYLMEKSYINALKQFHLAVAKGNVDALYHLGEIYSKGCEDADGIIIKSDILMAIRYYRQAADQGHTKAQIRLGNILVTGVHSHHEWDDQQQGVESKPILAFHYLTKAAVEGDDAEAMNALGQLYEIGFGSEIWNEEESLERARKWYAKSMEKGNATATFNLGSMYESGSGVEMSIEKALKLYIEAERRGSEDAKQRLNELADLASMDDYESDSDDDYNNNY